jgi:hypothetical protein
MAYEVWRPIKTATCSRIGEEVVFEARLVYPAEFLPDQPPRVLAHRCQRGLECNLLDRPACEWAGTLPGVNPLQ